MGVPTRLHDASKAGYRGDFGVVLHGLVVVVVVVVTMPAKMITDTDRK